MLFIAWSSRSAGHVGIESETIELVRTDFDHDGDVDHDDCVLFQACGSGSAVPVTAGCENKDLDGDDNVDQTDFAIFQRYWSGEGGPANPDCAT